MYIENEINGGRKKKQAKINKWIKIANIFFLQIYYLKSKIASNNQIRSNQFPLDFSFLWNIAS